MENENKTEEKAVEKKNRKMNMLEVFAVVEDVDKGMTAYIRVPIQGIYTKPDFHAAIRKGRIDLDSLKLKLGVEHITLVAMRPVDAVTPRTETVIKI